MRQTRGRHEDASGPRCSRCGSVFPEHACTFVSPRPTGPLPPPRTPGGRPDYAEILRLHAALASRSIRPTRDLADLLNVPYGTACAWVSRARVRGSQ